MLMLPEGHYSDRERASKDVAISVHVLCKECPSRRTNEETSSFGKIPKAKKNSERETNCERVAHNERNRDQIIPSRQLGCMWWSLGVNSAIWSAMGSSCIAINFEF